MIVTETAQHDLAGTPVHAKALFEQVMKYEHPTLVARVAREMGISAEDAHALFEDTKRFLFLCGTNPDGRWGPSQRIDKCWHYFILDTRTYRDFCNRFFGQFIHHRSNDPSEQKDVMRPRRTLALAKQLFGNLSENWRYENEKGVPVLGPGIVEAVGSVGPCDSCGCSPCDPS